MLFIKSCALYLNSVQKKNVYSDIFPLLQRTDSLHKLFTQGFARKQLSLFYIIIQFQLIEFNADSKFLFMTLPISKIIPF